jgi:hypothetical protein
MPQRKSEGVMEGPRDKGMYNPVISPSLRLCGHPLQTFPPDHSGDDEFESSFSKF